MVRRFLMASLAAALLAAGFAPSALAGDDWCDVDPTLLVTTPAGNHAVVYYVTGAYGTQHAATTQLATVSYSAAPANGGQATNVTLSVAVPNDAFGAGFPTRVVVSAGPWATYGVFGSAQGVSGQTMQVSFLLNIP